MRAGAGGDLREGARHSDGRAAGGFNSDECRRISVARTIPCPILDDGSPLPESAVIIAYLDEKFPDRPLTPKDPRAGRAWR